MATIKIHCPTCGQHYSLQPDFAGKKVVCEKCGAEFDVPMPEAARNRCSACPDCGGTISKKAQFCPHCGRPFDRVSLRGLIECVWVFVFPIALAGVLWLFGGNLFAAVLLVSAAIWLQTVTWTFFR